MAAHIYMSDAVWEERQANTLRHDAGADHADQRERRRDSQPVTKTGAAFCLLQGSIAVRQTWLTTARSSAWKKSENPCTRCLGVIRSNHQQSRASREWLETGFRL